MIKHIYLHNPLINNHIRYCISSHTVGNVEGFDYKAYSKNVTNKLKLKNCKLLKIHLKLELLIPTYPVYYILIGNIEYTLKRLVVPYLFEEKRGDMVFGFPWSEVRCA